MTTFQAHMPAHLDPTAPEDHMELSPAPAVDDDIDIDLDLDAGPVHDHDNDYIIEDAQSDSSAEHIGASAGVGNDDVMQDEEHVSTDTQLEDVEYHEEEVYDADYNIPDPPLPSDNQSLQVSGHSEDTTINPDNNTVISPLPTGPEDPVTVHGAQESADQNQDFSVDSTNPAVDARELTHSPHENQAHQSSEQVPKINELDHPEAGSVAHNPEQAAPLDETAASGPATEADDIEADDDALTDTYEDVDSTENYDNQPSVAGIHPVVVIYEGNEIYLFPPSKGNTSDTFFLPDESLALRNICDMFEAIRSVLAGSISEDDELDIAIERLGLQICEDSVHTRTTTLHQILTFYVQLLHQDGVDEPDPLYMTLTTRVRFSKKLNDITSAAAEGRGISQLLSWDSEAREQDAADYLTKNTDYSEGNENHSGSEAPDAPTEATTSPAEDSENVDTTGSRSTRVSPAASTEDSHQGLKNDDKSNSKEIAGNTNAGVSSQSVFEETSLSRGVPDAPGAHGSRSERPHAVDEQAINEAHREDAPEVTSITAEDDELHEDDLIDYDDDDEEEVKQQASTGSSTIQDDDRRTNGTLGYLVQPECFRSADCFCADCIVRIEEEYAAINVALSRRSSTGKSSHEIPNEASQDANHATDLSERYANEPGVSGEVEYYDHYNEDNYEETAQQEGQINYDHVELFDQAEHYGDGTETNDYLGYQESAENEYTVNESGDWNSGPWHIEGHTEIDLHEDQEDYVQPQDFHIEDNSADEEHYDETVPENAHLELLFDENVGEHPEDDDAQYKPLEANNGFGDITSGARFPSEGRESGKVKSTMNGKHKAPNGQLDIFSDASLSGKQDIGEAEGSRDAEGDELYEDDIFSDPLSNGDDPLNTTDRLEPASPASRISAKRAHSEIVDDIVQESGEQGK